MFVFRRTHSPAFDSRIPGQGSLIWNVSFGMIYVSIGMIYSIFPCRCMMVESDLRWLGLSDSKVAETIKNKSLTEQLVSIVKLAKQQLASVGQKLDVFPKGSLLYNVGSKTKAQCAHHLPTVVQLIVEDKIKTDIQATAAVSYILAHAMKDLNRTELEKECGVGIIVTPAEIEETVKCIIGTYKEKLIIERYQFPVGKILGDARAKLKWADGKYLATEVEIQLRNLLGVKTEDDLKPKSKVKGDQKQGEKKKADEVVEETEGPSTMEELIKSRARLHKVGENYTSDGYVVTPNTERLLKEHVVRTGGQVRTRFPPEPNGLLHIGHAKAININFAYAKAYNGVCNLRFDDTNPEKEEKKFFDGIEQMVRWLGYTPAKITYSSDNFDQLYKWAIELIEKGLAFVCHQTVEEMRGQDQKASPWRDRPVHESLRIFQDMKNGKLEEGDATLRLKLTLEEGKMDPVAYRIKYCHHERSHDNWCIYPTYDYTHCLCDSIEDITHSLCTKEFQSRRSSYYWLCNALDVYCPVQWEYGRLNVNYTVVSKRKILKLITSKIVRDWDDPRLFTLAALRRRGIPSEALNSFVARLGLTGSQMVIDPHLLDASVREYLNVHSPRTMAVLDPISVVITNYSSLGMASSISIPDFPSVPSSTVHDISFGSTIYIEREDYQSGTPSKEFRRLAMGQSVGLKHIGLVLEMEKEIVSDDGSVISIEVKAYKVTGENKPAAFIHWVANPIPVQVRLYERLFHHKNPEDTEEVPGGFLSDCNENSLTILHRVFVDKYMSTIKVWDRFQFERIGFFSVDPDTTREKIVFNRTLLLKEDSTKK
ncbi:qars-1 [Pristionchus pacificus]|uniref:Probable glutamine--tRNA ligase n=1 Tax=Pristionchus pacificus TaxID=54126 RepID=A0A2A6BYL4_PRIPA|nr:qars-1 [Pristionchus pacificus]|eukprot:PDM70917.1 qars-1 [Pristionchus pacificus]